MDRFFHPSGLSHLHFSLSEAESHHAARVLRKEVGDPIEIFDGHGQSAVAEIISVKKDRVDVRIVERHVPMVRSTPQVILAVAPPKGDRLKWLVEKATELGVDQFTPLLTERTVVEPGAGKIDKLQASVIAACKQSGHNFVMQITDNSSLANITKANRTSKLVNPACASDPPESTDPCPVVLLGDPNGEWFSPEMIPREASSVVLLIGPEGGWTPDELTMVDQAGVRRVRFADQILRTETAAIQMAGLCLWARRSGAQKQTAQGNP